MHYPYESRHAWTKKILTKNHEKNFLEEARIFDSQKTFSRDNKINYHNINQYNPHKEQHFFISYSDK